MARAWREKHCNKLATVFHKCNLTCYIKCHHVSESFSNYAAGTLEGFRKIKASCSNCKKFSHVLGGHFSNESASPVMPEMLDSRAYGMVNERPTKKSTPNMRTSILHSDETDYGSVRELGFFFVSAKPPVCQISLFWKGDMASFTRAMKMERILEICCFIIH